MKQTQSISFLLGSGFSKPAGLPLASEINERFARIKESEFSIHTDGTAWFHNGKPGPNDWFMRKEIRLFVEWLLNHYCTSVVTPESFHYERFYDWYKDLQNGESSDPAVKDIAANLGKRTVEDYLHNFDLTFNQLLAQLVGKRFSEIHHGQGSPPSHCRFLDFLGALGRERVLHFHSLNHDLFFESLSSSDAIQGELSDGFEELGSPYFGRLEHIIQGKIGEGLLSYTVRLRRFVDEFDSRFNLYKLHGSIDHYVFRDDERTTVKSKWGIGPNGLMKEVSQDGKLIYWRGVDNYYPDFLSGTTSKTRRYKSTSYYRSMFDHFGSNLQCSSLLVVIGYGFADEEINCLVGQYYLTGSNSKIIIIDVREPQLPPEFRDSAEFFNGGVSHADYRALLDLILARDR